MSATVIPYRFLARGGTADALAALNEVPLIRELIVEVDTLKMKLGDGATSYNALPYIVQPIPALPPGIRTGQLSLGAGDRVNPVPVGLKALTPVTFPCDIKGYVLVLVTDDGASGSVSVDLRRVSYTNYTHTRPTSGDSILSAPLEISAGVKATGGVTGFTATQLAANDIVAMAINSRSSNVVHVALAVLTEKN
jgi:hypothetical protein